MNASAPQGGGEPTRFKEERAAFRIEPDRRAEEAREQRNVRRRAMREVDFLKAEAGAAGAAKHVGSDGERSEPHLIGAGHARCQPLAAEHRRAPLLAKQGGAPSSWTWSRPE